MNVIGLCMRFEERELEPRFDDARGETSFGRAPYKYLYRSIETIDKMRNSVKQDMSLTFFDQEANPLHSAGEILCPILCSFSDGTFQVLPVGYFGVHAKIFLGVRYIKLVSWACLPVPESADNPGTKSKRLSFFTQTNTVFQASFRELVIFDYHFIWRNQLHGASQLASNLASLWKKGYDTITSLGSELTKFLNSSVTNSENSN